MNILEEYEATDVECNTKFKVKKTDRIRVREVFTILPLWLNRFSWMQKVSVQERLLLVSREEFNDGWSYKHYWSKEYEQWEKEKIL